MKESEGQEKTKRDTSAHLPVRRGTGCVQLREQVDRGRMNLSAMVLVSLAALVSRAAAREFDYCYAYEQDPYLLMGTKTAYQFVQGRSRLPPVPNCTPVQIWILSRHGTRYPGRKSITQLLTLPKLRDQIIYNHDNRGNGRLCNADLDFLRHWSVSSKFNETIADYLAVPQGEQDLRLLAKRLQTEFPEVLRQNPNYHNYKFRATQTQRTRASLEAFQDGLFNNKDAVPPENTPVNDSLLHLYKNCPEWENSLTRDNVDYESERFISGPEYQDLVANVSRRLGFAYHINNDSVQLMYDMCRYEKALEISRLSAWCSVFSKEEMKILEYLEDLNHYYYNGPGRDINKKLGCPLAKDMFNHFRNLEKGNFGDEPKGIFYFSHTITLQSLLNVLEIGKDSTPLTATNRHLQEHRKFRTSILGSFAANLVAVFYRCSDTQSANRVIFYAGEMPVQLDGCRVGLCDWDFLKDKFGRFADECTLNFCNDPNSASGLHRPWLVLAALASLGLLRYL